MRKLSGLILVFVLTLALASAGSPSQQRGVIDSHTNVGAEGLRIAIPEFQSTVTDPKVMSLTNTFNKVLWDDLDYSGSLVLVSRSFYPSGKVSGPADVRPDAWTVGTVDAPFIAFGNSRMRGGQFYIEARLWDLKNPQNREIIATGFGSEDNDAGARLIAHKFADAIVEKLGAGIGGISQTRLAFISERTAGVKELYVMDYDGNDAHALTSYRSIAMSPAWAPDNLKIAFTTFRRGASDIEILSPDDRRQFPFERAGGTTMTPAWSPDGSRIAFATSRDGSDMEIYVADWNGRNMRRVTVSKGVDSSPVWNPKTGRQIAFISDRSGSPQIYIMDAEGTNVTRLVEEGGHTDEPAWSPDGQRIAFAWQRSARGSSNFDIYVHDLGTGINTQMTHDAGDNERPTWAPDSRHLAFESSRNGTRQIFSMTIDGMKLRQLTTTGKNTAPAWSGYFKR